MHIWDSLILSGPTMIILIGVSILKSIRDVLLSFNFEQCILLFSDAPDVDVEAIIVDARALFSTTRPSLCARQYSGIPSELREGNYQVPDIITLKTQICPCISIHDFMELTVLGDGSDASERARRRSGESSETKGSGPALAIDIRSLSEYLAGALDTDHVNIPFENAFRETGDDIKEEHLHAIRPWKGKPLIIIEKRSKNAARFAEALIKEGYPKVSILNGGASVLRVQGLLHTAGAARRGASRGTNDPTSPDDMDVQLEFGEAFGEGGGYYDNI
jgi:TBC domain-containing protein kinase-like protein